MSAIGQLAMSVGKSASQSAGASAGGNLMNQIGYGLGNLTGYNKSVADDQLEQERALSGIQLAANKEQMKYNHDLQYEMWNKTSPAEQLKKIKEAGLNPALMYSSGGGGVGGASMGSGGGGGAGKSNASDETSRKMADMQAQGMALQNAKLKSELELLNAQADNLNADTEKKRGVDTKEAYTRIDNLLKDINNKELEGLGMKLQNEFDNIRNEIGQITKDFEIKRSHFESMNTQLIGSKLVEETKILEANGKVAVGTVNSIINKVNAEVNNLLMDSMLKAAQIRGIDTNNDKIKAEINEIQANIGVLVRTNEFKEADVNLRREMMENEIKKSWIQFGGQALGSLVNVATMFLPGGMVNKAVNTVKPAKVGY